MTLSPNQLEFPFSKSSLKTQDGECCVQDQGPYLPVTFFTILVYNVDYSPTGGFLQGADGGENISGIRILWHRMTKT